MQFSTILLLLNVITLQIIIMYIRLAFIFFTILVIVGCSDDEESTKPNTYTFTIQPTFNGESFAQYDNYKVGTDSINFTRARFFLTNPTLHQGTNTQQLDTSFLVELQQDDLTAPYQPKYDFSFPNSSFTAIDSISFLIGIDSTANKSTPSDYIVGHPLSNTAEYWTVWESYMFVKLEGKVKYKDESKYSHSYTYHTGMDTFARSISLAPTNMINANSSSTINLALDEIFTNINLKQDTLSHSNPNKSNQMELSSKITANFTNAFKLK